jgi:hypothetical protein
MRELSMGLRHEFSEVLGYLDQFMEHFAERREIECLLFVPRATIKEEKGCVAVLHPRREFRQIGLVDDSFGCLLIEQKLEGKIGELIQVLWSALRLDCARDLQVFLHSAGTSGEETHEASRLVELFPVAGLSLANRTTADPFTASFVCHLVSCPFTNRIPSGALDYVSGLLVGFLRHKKPRTHDQIVSVVKDDLAALASNIASHFTGVGEGEMLKTVFIDYGADKIEIA